MKRGRKKGHFVSDETKEKISNSLKGNTPWNKNLKGVIKLSKETKEKISIKNKVSMKGNSNGSFRKSILHSEETKNKIRLSKLGSIPWNYGLKTGLSFWKGKKRPEISGINHYNWKNGKSFEPYPIYWNESLKKKIRERDKYVCKICGKYGKYVHHIDYNKNNCDELNLITLCVSCHSKTNYNREEWIKFFTLQYAG